MKRKIYCDHLEDELRIYHYHYETDHVTLVLCYSCLMERIIRDKLSQQTGAIYEQDLHEARIVLHAWQRSKMVLHLLRIQWGIWKGFKMTLQDSYYVGILNDDDTWELSNPVTASKAVDIREFLISMPRQNFTENNVEIFKMVSVKRESD